MNVGSYLRRLEYRGPVEATVETLVGLHRCHLRRVPFENLDIPLGQPIDLSRRALFDKIVQRRRGGFCYELNGLFAWLLGELGYDVAMLSARVFNGGKPGPDFDHMTLLVDLGAPFIADVGFGDSFVEPIPLENTEVLQRGRGYRFVESGGAWVLQQREAGSVWESRYLFTLKPHPMDDFRPMCHYQQTSPESNFTKKSVCSRMTGDGRVTLSNGRLILTKRGERQDRVVESVEDYRELLELHFGMRLDDHDDLSLDTLLVSGKASPP